MAINGTRTTRGRALLIRFVESALRRAEDRLPVTSPEEDPEAIDRELLDAARARCRNGCGNTAFESGCGRCHEMAEFARDLLAEMDRQRRAVA